MQNTLAVISLQTIVRNAQLVQSRAGVPLIAVVKDDAYGHGAERVSLEIEPHVDGFAVATVSEGVALRVSGIGKEILVLTPCLCEEEALCCAAYRLTPTVTSFASMRLLIRASKEYGLPIRSQLKVNTGMNRYGFRPALVERACRDFIAAKGELSGVFSHFYSPEDEGAREKQFALFMQASEKVRKYFPTATRHLSATGGLLAGEKYHLDAVRCGIAIYGYLPRGFEGRLPVKPAMKLYAAVAQSGKFTGGGVCYGKANHRYGNLSTMRLGYGDGFPRMGKLGNINELCMDAYVQEGAAPFGKRLLVLSDVAAYARENGTIVYEALVNITKKAEKVYVR